MIKPIGNTEKCCRETSDNRSAGSNSQVETYDFSAHADRDGILELLSAYEDVTALVNHGNRCEVFAEELRKEGFAAAAPDLGETVAP